MCGVVDFTLYYTRSLTLLRQKAVKLLKQNNDKGAQEAWPSSVRKSAIRSAIETISKLSVRKKLPPIVIQQRLARKKLSQVKEVATSKKSNKSALKGPKPRHALNHLRSKKTGQEQKRFTTRPSRHHFKRQRRRLVGFSSSKAAAYRKKNLMSQYQF